MKPARFPGLQAAWAALGALGGRRGALPALPAAAFCRGHCRVVDLQWASSRPAFTPPSPASHSCPLCLRPGELGPGPHCRLVSRLAPSTVAPVGPAGFTEARVAARPGSRSAARGLRGRACAGPRCFARGGRSARGAARHRVNGGLQANSPMHRRKQHPGPALAAEAGAWLVEENARSPVGTPGLRGHRGKCLLQEAQSCFRTVQSPAPVRSDPNAKAKPPPPPFWGQFFVNNN
jgi:hypothetical protein